MRNPPAKIVIAGGGTGGHVQPAIAVAGALRGLSQVDLTWIGSSAGVERDIAASYQIRFFTIPTGKLRRYLSLHTLIDAVRIPFGVLRARLHLRTIQPDVIFSTGGFVSVPTVIAGWMAGIPIITHEQTATAGLANRINARFADRIALAFQATADEFPGRDRQIVVTGNPVRPELLDGDAGRARTNLNIPSELPVTYITGGSLGAQALNSCVRTLISSLCTQAFVIHQCGPTAANGDYPRLLETRETLQSELRDRYVVRERLGSELADIYAVADVVIGRAGAGTVAELALLGKPSILIPLPGAAGDEQTRNARVLADVDAAILIPQSNLTPERLGREVSALLNDRERLDRMAVAAQTVAQPDAANLLAEEILALARATR
jgi:UDP-N-acetylglucosamine--N-acetylmuramyl-(pentapeptide) pyrophosphoryl-undecaprenol N-acetylglucosamine transferase